MARGKKKGSDEEKLEMNMTPMLDVVFNLIIFFMIVTDMTQQELEQLVLPFASEAVKDEGEDIKKRMIINIERDGVIKIKRTEYSLDDLGPALFTFAEFNRDDAGLCDEPVLIRCDYNTDFRFVQNVMQKCADKKIKIWKVQLAAAQPQEDD